jgi:hypothetical protein
MRGGRSIAVIVFVGIVVEVKDGYPVGVASAAVPLAGGLKPGATGEGHRDDQGPVAVEASWGSGVVPLMRPPRPIPRSHLRAIAMRLTVSRAHQGLSPTNSA